MLTTISGYDLDETDTLVTQGFNYKVNTDISGADYAKLPVSKKWGSYSALGIYFTKFSGIC